MVINNNQIEEDVRSKFLGVRKVDEVALINQ